MRRRVSILIPALFVSMLWGVLAFPAPPSRQDNGTKLSKTGVFRSPSDLFYIKSDLIYSYDMARGKLAEYAFHKNGSIWEKLSVKDLPELQPVALGACDPLNQVDLTAQYSEFASLPAVASHNLKQVIETESYALIVVLERGSHAGGSELNLVLALPKGSGWIQETVLPVSSNAEFCVAQSLKTTDGNQSVFVFYDEVAGSGELFGVTTFDLYSPKISRAKP